MSKNEIMAWWSACLCVYVYPAGFPLGFLSPEDVFYVSGIHAAIALGKGTVFRTGVYSLSVKK